MRSDFHRRPPGGAAVAHAVEPARETAPTEGASSRLPDSGGPVAKLSSLFTMIAHHPHHVGGGYALA